MRRGRCSTPRLLGRLGAHAAARLRAEASEDGWQTLGDTPYTLAELRDAACHERVMHLDDLMPRRTRLGLVSREGGREFLPRVRQAVQSVLGWDHARWMSEEAAYLALWTQRHAPA